MFVVDTNVLVHAANRDAAEYDDIRSSIATWSSQATPWYVTWGIVYEFLRVVTHPRVLRNPFSIADAWGVVTALLSTPSVSLLVETDRHAGVVADALAEMPRLGGNLVHDAHVAVLMREHGIRQIMTLDGDFHRFPWVEVVDPLA